MKTTREWAKIWWSEQQELREFIYQVQADALESASKIVMQHKYQKGSMNYNQGYMAGQILTLKSKTLAAMPNDRELSHGACDFRQPENRSANRPA